MAEKIEGVNPPQEREKSKQEYLDEIKRFEELLDEMRGRFFSEAGTIERIREQIFSLKDYIINEPT